jgi:hypothetical protein
LGAVAWAGLLSGNATAQDAVTPQAAVAATTTAQQAAPKRPSFAELEATLDGVIKSLVEGNVISPEQAGALRQQAADAARTTVNETPPVAAEKVIRVPYVPESTKQEIRDQVRGALREDVVGDVLQQAKQERWGVPGVLPAWIDKIKFKGDVRLRAQSDMFGPSNAENGYLDFNTINAKGGIGRAGPDAFLNTTEDRFRLRTRARLGMDATLTNSLKAGLRLSTGNATDPVSTNQTLGTYANRYQTLWDQVYLKFDGYDSDRYNWLTLWGGRIPNPWLSSDLVWDDDLGFEGIAATLRMNLHFGGGLLDQDDNRRTAFFTAGAFPLQEVERSGHDKWLYGAQVGTEWVTLRQSVFKLGAAYYAYENIVGERNDLDSTLKDFTAPRFVQKGNTMFDIRNDVDASTNLYALAADYKLVNVTATVDVARFAPTHLWFTLDYVDNVGFDSKDIEKRTGEKVDGKTKGYQCAVTVGWPDVGAPRNWRVNVSYRYLERDAVLDAFTDSDFHLGGTDAKGWIVGGEYGLMQDAWLRLRYMSSDEIDGPPLAIDVVQLEINARF